MWKTIAGNEKYSVSDEGEIKNNRTNSILLPEETFNGYLRVILYGKHYRVHRLVAEAFLENDDVNKNQINHIDGDKKNNKACNLEWCTAKQNTEHAIKNGLKHVCFDGIRSPKKVLQIDMDGNIIKSFESIKDVERATGFNNSNISKACRGKQKTAYGYKWRFASL